MLVKMQCQVIFSLLFLEKQLVLRYDCFYSIGDPRACINNCFDIEDLIRQHKFVLWMPWKTLETHWRLPEVLCFPLDAL